MPKRVRNASPAAAAAAAAAASGRPESTDSGIDSGTFDDVRKGERGGGGGEEEKSNLVATSRDLGWSEPDLAVRFRVRKGVLVCCVFFSLPLRWGAWRR